MIQFYAYDRCGTCRKAEKYLKDRGVEYKKIDITLKPPSVAILKKILKNNDHLEIKQFRNTSGVDYRSDKIAEKLKILTEMKQLELLASNGRYLKRPILFNGSRASVGFKDVEKFDQVIS